MIKLFEGYDDDGDVHPNLYSVLLQSKFLYLSIYLSIYILF